MSATPRFGSATVLLVATLLLPGRARAQEYAQLVWDQLQTRHQMARGDNYKFNRYLIGVLNGGTSDTWNLQFSAGRTYLLAGVCDGDCSDIDLVVTDNTGKVIVQDLATDDFPTVTFDVTRGGQLSVKVSMHSCSANPCYWGLGMWSRER